MPVATQVGCPGITKAHRYVQDQKRGPSDLLFEPDHLNLLRTLCPLQWKVQDYATPNGWTISWIVAHPIASAMARKRTLGVSCHVNSYDIWECVSIHFPSLVPEDIFIKQHSERDFGVFESCEIWVRIPRGYDSTKYLPPPSVPGPQTISMIPPFAHRFRASAMKQMQTSCCMKCQFHDFVLAFRPATF